MSEEQKLFRSNYAKSNPRGAACDPAARMKGGLATKLKKTATTKDTNVDCDITLICPCGVSFLSYSKKTKDIS
jgi:hypothetical protein